MPPLGGGHGGGHASTVRSNASSLRVHDTNKESTSEIRFEVLDEGLEVFRDYGVSHTKEMHLIVVRNDLRHFHHLHPTRAPGGGEWSVPFSPIAGGTYWLYADFVNREGDPHTIRWEKVYEGAEGPKGITKDFGRVKRVGGYEVHLKVIPSDDGVAFGYDIKNTEGEPVALEEYLGAKGHSVLISPAASFVHTHPFTEYVGYKEDDPPVFFVENPRDPFYRVFTQFQIQGKVLTVEFDWEQ